MSRTYFAILQHLNRIDCFVKNDENRLSLSDGKAGAGNA